MLGPELPEGRREVAREISELILRGDFFRGKFAEDK